MSRDRRPVFRTVERLEYAPEQVSEGMRVWAGFLVEACRRRLRPAPAAAPRNLSDETNHAV